LKQLLRDQNADEENQQPTTMLSDMNELKPLNSPEREMISLDKHKLEVEQRVSIEGAPVVLSSDSTELLFRNTSKNCCDIVIEN
jgi:hypothetical protein